MITKEHLNQDQLASFEQMTMGGGISETQALELIDEYCIQRGYTGLRAAAFGLTQSGKAAAKALVQDADRRGLGELRRPVD